MPTWAMHLLTSKKVSKKININSNLFAFGNILPDIPNKFVVKDIRNYIPHSKSHFETEVLVLEHIEKRYDLRTFANAFWIFLICIYFAIAMAVLIESSEQTRIRRQQYFQQYEVPNETHKNVVIENSIKSQLI